MARSIDWKMLAAVSPLLEALPEVARASARLVSLAPDDRLFRRGDKPRAIHFVITGEIRLIRQSATGAEIVLQRARQGFVAEASLGQNAYHCDAVTLAASSVLAIPSKAFAEALDDKEFRTKWIGHLARELRRIRAQAERLALKSARERIVHFIETEGNGGSIDLTVSKKDWAGELGLTHEALYRALAAMQKGGLIEVDGPSIRLISFV